MCRKNLDATLEYFYKYGAGISSRRHPDPTALRGLSTAATLSCLIQPCTLRLTPRRYGLWAGVCFTNVSVHTDTVLPFSPACPKRFRHKWIRLGTKHCHSRACHLLFFLRQRLTRSLGIKRRRAPAHKLPPSQPRPRAAPFRWETVCRKPRLQMREGPRAPPRV